MTDYEDATELFANDQTQQPEIQEIQLSEKAQEQLLTPDQRIFKFINGMCRGTGKDDQVVIARTDYFQIVKAIQGNEKTDRRLDNIIPIIIDEKPLFDDLGEYFERIIAVQEPFNTAMFGDLLEKIHAEIKTADYCFMPIGGFTEQRNRLFERIGALKGFAGNWTVSKNGYKYKKAFLDHGKEGLYNALQDEFKSLKEFKSIAEFSGIYAMNEFDELQVLNMNKNKQVISSGFSSLDKLLHGGVHPKFYVIGAVPGLGKTTFILQIADNMAKNGVPVLFFSLEMSRTELIAKSISRLTAIESEQGYSSIKAYAQDHIQVMYGEAFKSEKQQSYEVLGNAIQKYKAEIQNNIWIVEGIGNISAKEIRARIEEFRSAYQKTPVVFVDYLQIIAPEDVRMNEKQSIDKTVMELKRISRDYKTPVFAVSSYNRSNYKKEEASMEAFKESGAIEYSADVLFGMEYTEKNRDLKQINADAKKGDPVKIDLVTLKNRLNYKMNITFDLYPRYNYYKEQ